MKKILDLQKNFVEHLYKKTDQKILKEIPYNNIETLARLNIYRNNVWGNFNGILQSIFGVTKQLVGEKYFEQLCQKYHQKYHSKSGSLDSYGDEFPDFLKRIKSQHNLPYLPDLSRLELLYHHSYYAADCEIFDVKKFQKIAPEKFYDLKFELHPSCFLVASKFPIFSIWKENIENGGKKKIALEKSEFVLVKRISGDVKIQNLSQEEFIFLKALSDNKTLFDTYKKISRATKKECDIGKILNEFISDGVIINFKL